MNKFLALASQTSILGDDEFARHVMKIWHNLEEDAKRARDLLNADPDNDALAKSALEKAERFLVFGEMMKFGHSMVEKAVERFKSDDSQTSIDVVEELRDRDDDDDGSTRN